MHTISRNWRPRVGLAKGYPRSYEQAILLSGSQLHFFLRAISLFTSKLECRSSFSMLEIQPIRTPVGLNFYRVTTVLLSLLATESSSMVLVESLTNSIVPHNSIDLTTSSFGLWNG